MNDKQHKIRKAAFDAYVEKSVTADIHREIAWLAFNAGWEARRKAEYELSMGQAHYYIRG